MPSHEATNRLTWSAEPAGTADPCEHGLVPRLALAALVAAVCTSLAPAAAGAAPATLKGKLTGATLPAPGKGVSTVRAIDVDSTVVVAADHAGRRGGFSLRVPPGRYGLLATVLPLDGPKAIEKVVGRVRLKSGARRSVKLAVKKKAKHRKRGRKRRRRAGASAVPDAFGDVAVSHPAIAVRPFVAADPAYQYLGKGLMDMLITDLGAAVSGPCRQKVVFVERARIDSVLDEIAQSQGPAFDPRSRPRPGRIIIDNAKITGTLLRVNGVFTTTAAYTDLRTGATATFTETSPDFFEMERRLAERLARHLCEPPAEPPVVPPLVAPAAYEGTFSGFLDDRAGGAGHIPLDVTWTGGTLRFANRQAAGIPFPDDGTFQYSVVSGSATVTVRYRRGAMGGCDFDGTEAVDFGPVLGQASGALVTYPGNGPPYRLTVGFPPMSSVTYTKSNCSPGSEPEEGQTGDWPLYGFEAAAPDDVQMGSAGSIAGSVHEANPGLPAYDFTWSFSPAQP